MMVRNLDTFLTVRCIPRETKGALRVFPLAGDYVRSMRLGKMELS